MLSAADAKAVVMPSSFYAHELPSMPEPRGPKPWQNGGLCPFHADTRPNSFYVNLRTGAYRCFSCGASGGDLIAFIQERDGMGFREALQRLAEDWGGGVMAVAATNNRTRPAGVPAHFRGKPFVYAWRYPWGHVARFEDANGKATPPFQHDGRNEAPPAPRVLYGLKSLESADDTAYVCEGEKCAAAMHTMGLPCVTSMGGSNAADKSDWGPVARFSRVVFLPDADESGEGYVADVARLVATLPGEREILVARLPGLPDGGDVVDWMRERQPAWDGYGPIPREPRDGLREELLHAIDGVATVTGRATGADSSIEPIPLEADTPPPCVFPADALGDVLGGAVEALREGVQAPDSVCGNSILAAASLAVQGHANIVIDGRVSPCSLFAITVAETGERKTAADREALAPHREFQRELADQYASESERYRIEHAAFKKAESDALSKAKGYAAKRKALEELGPPPVEPLRPFILTGDCTLEGAHKLLLNGWPSIGIFSDEGGQLVGGHAMNPDNLLKTASGLSVFWDGSDSARVRSGDGAALLSGRRVALHLMMQPAVADLVFGSDMLAGQGLLSRTLAAWPDSTAGTRFYRPIDLTADARMQRYRAQMLSILHAPLPLREGTRNGLEPRCISLSADAYSMWVEYHDFVEHELGEEGRLALIRGFGNKAAEHAARIAGVLALVDDACASEISSTHIAAGIRLCDFYLKQALRVHQRGRVNPDLVLARRLLDWLHKRDSSVVTLREICQYGPNPVRDAEKAKRIMAVLVEHGYAKTREPRTWRING